MSWAPDPPYNNCMFVDKLTGSDTRVPQTEDRVHIRISTTTKKALIDIQTESELQSLTNVATLGLYYARDKIKYGYGVDWQEFTDWFQGYLRASREEFSGGIVELDTFGFEYQPSLEQTIWVRPKERNLDWYEIFRRFTQLDTIPDCYRVLLRYAILCYNWEWYGGDVATSWTATPRKTIWELEEIIQDRKARMEESP